MQVKEKNHFIIEMGKRIASRRKALHYTQAQLAEKSELSIQLISTAERGTKALRPENLVKVCTALNVSADYILTGAASSKDSSEISEKIKNLSADKRALLNEIIEMCVSIASEKNQ